MSLDYKRDRLKFAGMVLKLNMPRNNWDILITTGMCIIYRTFVTPPPQPTNKIVNNDYWLGNLYVVKYILEPKFKYASSGTWYHNVV